MDWGVSENGGGGGGYPFEGPLKGTLISLGCKRGTSKP